MKYILTFGLLFSSLFVAGQDLIVMQNDVEIIAKITEIKKNRVLYRDFDKQEGEDQNILKRDVYMIIYEDGMKQFFSDPRDPKDIFRGTALEEMDGATALELYQKGIEDAKVYYTKNGALWGTFAATALVPVYGIFTGAATAIVVGAIPPSPDGRFIPNPELYRDPNYAQGYNRRAHLKKIGRVATGYLLGLTVQTAMILIIVSTF
ncbi:MAG: hypothetical protein AAF206_10180 [Bacteroidota bacterium]